MLALRWLGVGVMALLLGGCGDLANPAKLIEENEQAIQTSSLSIRQNQQAVDESTKTIAANEATVRGSTEAIARNQQEVERLTPAIEKVQGIMPGHRGFVIAAAIVGVVGLIFLGALVALAIGVFRVGTALRRIEDKARWSS